MFSGAIGAVIAIALVTYLSQRAASHETEGELRHGAFMKVFGWLQIAASIGLLYVTIFVNHGGQYVPLVALLTIFGVGGAATLIEAYGSRGTFDDEQIAFETKWTGKKVQQWANLEAVKFNASMMWYVLTFRDGTKIRFSNLLHGHGAVLTRAEQLGLRVQ